MTVRQDEAVVVEAGIRLLITFEDTSDAGVPVDQGVAEQALASGGAGLLLFRQPFLPDPDLVGRRR